MEEEGDEVGMKVGEREEGRRKNLNRKRGGWRKLGRFEEDWDGLR